MKSTILAISTLFAAIVFFSFKDNNTYKIDTQKSGMTWNMPITNGEHYGTIQVKSGYLLYDGQSITGGTFNIDLNSVKDLDLEKEKQPKIEAHIRSEDFFETAKYPVAVFTIDKVAMNQSNHLIASGKLTIKNITKRIEFPIRMREFNNTLYVTADKIEINRKDYGIMIKDKGMKGKLEEMVIHDVFTVGFSIVVHP